MEFDPLSIYVTILAHSAGNWTPDQVKEAYEYVLEQIDSDVLFEPDFEINGDTQH